MATRFYVQMHIRPAAFFEEHFDTNNKVGLAWEEVLLMLYLNFSVIYLKWRQAASARIRE